MLSRNLTVLLALLLSAACVSAESPLASPGKANARDLKARLSERSAHETDGFLLSPLELQDGSRLTVISPTAWAPLSKRLTESLSQTHTKFTRLFGPIPPLQISVHLMEEEAFYLKTRAPRWTNAMYYKGKIVIPISGDEPIDYDNLYRSMRHEYVHAIVHSLSGGQCPGWLDEGIAQWAEGSENPALRPALLRWLTRHAPVPLSLLQGGYTKLEVQIVPAAYAQSLFMTNTMINTYGFKSIGGYFKRLRMNEDGSSAFQRSFQLKEEMFEAEIDRLLRRWAAENEAKKNFAKKSRGSVDS